MTHYYCTCGTCPVAAMDEGRGAVPPCIIEAFDPVAFLALTLSHPETPRADRLTAARVANGYNEAPRQDWVAHLDWAIEFVGKFPEECYYLPGTRTVRASTLDRLVKMRERVLST